MKISRIAATGAVGVLVGGAALAAVPAQAATVEEVGGEYSAEFNIRNSINDTNTQSLLGGPTDEGAHVVTMTVTPAAAAAGDAIEVQVTSPTLVFRNGPVVGSNANESEITAVIEIDGTDYQLRGPRPTVNSASGAAAIDAGWVISSTAGNSSGATGGTAATTGAGTVEWNSGDSEGTATAATLEAPAADGAYEVVLKAIINNAIAGSSNLLTTNPFDAIYGTAPAPDLIGGPDGYLQQDDSNGFYNFEAPSTPSPTPTATDTATTTPTPAPTATVDPPADGIDTSPRTASETLDIYCGFNNFPLAPVVNETWPTTLTVSPGAAAPGSTVGLEVEVDGTTLNGPVAIAAGDFRMEATVEFEGDTIQLIGPEAGDVAVEAPIFTNLPVVAEGVVTLPDAEGDFPIVLTDIWYNHAGAGGSIDSLDDILDMRCNLSADPVGAPESIGLTVDVTSDASAPRVDAPVPGGPDGGPNGGPNGGPDGGPDGGPTGPVDTLPETGPNETLIVALAAIVALQIGLMLTVRAVRSKPIIRIRS